MQTPWGYSEQSAAASPSSPSGIIEWIFIAYACGTAWLCLLWFMGMHGSDGAGQPYTWFSAELVAGAAISAGALVALAKPIPRRRIPMAMVLAAFHSLLGVQYVTGIHASRAWALLPVAYSLVLVATLVRRHATPRGARPN